jgi:transcriptional regulator with XRE-family HTH domain
MTETETLGRRIARLRKAAGLTQRGLAEKAGVSLSTLRNWEQGAREPLASAVVKLADALGVTADEVLRPVQDGAEQPPARPGRPKKGEGETKPRKRKET